MIRVGFFILVGAVLFVAVTGWTPWLFIVPAGVLAVLAYTAGGMKLRCTHCGKRIKVGYTRCHHCGADFGNAKRAAPPG